jgi:two-component system sensor histidine kinase PhcS
MALQNSDNTLRIGYLNELSEVQHIISRSAAYTCCGLVLLGIGLDYYLYHSHLFQFTLARIVCCCFILCFVALLKTSWGQSRVQWITPIWLLFPQLMIAWMIYVTEGAFSVYYIGLTFSVYALGIVMAFGVLQNVFFGILTFLLYIIACVFHPDWIRMQSDFMAHSLFLLMSIVISMFFSFYNERARFTLYKLKTEVAEKNIQLEETNKNLTDIKGQMLQQEKMASIGTLAAGLLHEVNNPVNYCLMAIGVALEEPVVKTTQSLRECLVDAQHGMQRIQHIVSDLKIFAYRPSETERSEADFMLERAVNSSLRLVGHEIKGITITRDIPQDSLVHGDEAAIVGVLINLFSNAALALRKVGRENPSIHVSAVWQADRLLVTVQDNGPGIAPENLTRVFEPFFTTRDVGQGLGLGLSISYGVIARHGGTLRAESALGEWTKMIFDLPRAK